MKNSTIAHAQLMRSVLTTIAKAGVTSMRELRQIVTLYTLFLNALTPWLADTLMEPQTLARLKAAGMDLKQTRVDVTLALTKRESPHDGSCKVDLALRQARRDPDAALAMMFHTVHFICLDMTRAARRAS
ncbi:MAG: hypothetical protein IJE07_14330 [Clostridia bacterium]|nr:hypothetical protein [Clostridia bacterium]